MSVANRKRKPFIGFGLASTISAHLQHVLRFSHKSIQCNGNLAICFSGHLLCKQKCTHDKVQRLTGELKARAYAIVMAENILPTRRLKCKTTPPRLADIEKRDRHNAKNRTAKVPGHIQVKSEEYAAAVKHSMMACEPGAAPVIKSEPQEGTVHTSGIHGAAMSSAGPCGNSWVKAEPH